MEDLATEKRIKTVVCLLSRNERLKRIYLAAEAESIGWGGMGYVSKVAGVDKDTVTAGKKDLDQIRKNPGTQNAEDTNSSVKSKLDQDRIRAKGGGRKSVKDSQPGLVEALLKLVDGNEY